MIPEIRDDRQQRALTGVTIEKISTLETAVALALNDEKERAYQEVLPREHAKESRALVKKANYRLLLRN